MDKQLKNFFENYEEQMTPEVNLDSLKERVSSIRQNKLSKKQAFSIKHLIVGLTVLVISLFSGIFIHFANQKTNSDGDGGKKLYDYLDENFSEYSGIPIFVERELASDLQVFFYQAKNDEELFLVVFLVSPKNYPFTIGMDNNIILELNTKENNVGSFIVLDKEINLNLNVQIKDEVFSKTVKLTFEK